MAEERAVLRVARQGQLEAYNERVRAYEGLAFRVAYHLLGEDEAAAEVTQAAFRQLYRPHASKGEGSFRNRLLSTVLALGQEWLHRCGGRPPRSRSAERGDAVTAALYQLPDRQRVLIVLRDMEGLSYAEIAQAARLDWTTVKDELRRARAHLRALVGEAGQVAS